MYGLIFDLDGVLADTERLSETAGIRAFKDLCGVEVHREDFQPFIGTGSVRYMQGVAEAYGFDVDVEEAVAARQRHFEELLSTGECIALPGAAGLIETVREARTWRLAIATSSPEKKARITLRAAGIDLKDFDVFVHGDLVERRKPDPAVFLLAAEQLGLAPIACVVIEDAITGIEAALAAGMGCIAVTNSFTGDRLAKANFVVPSLEDVTLDLLRRAVEHDPAASCSGC